MKIVGIDYSKAPVIRAFSKHKEMITMQEVTVKNDNILHIYTDGACLGNPGPGGWAFVMLFNGIRKESAGYAPSPTTNNRMEMMAPISALNALKKDRRYTIRLYSDSQYLINGMNKWLANWKRKGWRGTRGPVKNRELWETLDALNRLHDIEWIWIRGHASNEYNNFCDYLANEQIRLNHPA